MARVSCRLVVGALCAVLLAAEAPGPNAEKPAPAGGKKPASKEKPPAAEGGEKGGTGEPGPPAKPDPAVVLKEIEAAEKPILARLEALASPPSAAVVARRLQAPLAAARRKAYLAIYKEPNPANFYATKSGSTDGYDDSAAREVEALSMEVLAFFKDGAFRDPETMKAYEEASAAFEALAARRKEAGLPKAAKDPDDLLALCRTRVSEAMIPLADRAVLERNAAATGPEQPLERDASREFNLYRVAMGFKAIRLDPRLYKAARGHSEEMARLGYFSHVSPAKERRELSQRTALAGFPGSNVAECIAKMSSMEREDPFSPVGEWIASPPHHKSMLAPHDAFGLGTALSGGGAGPPAGDEPPAADEGAPSDGGEPVPPAKKASEEKGKAKGKGPKASREWTLVLGSLAPPRRIVPPPGNGVDPHPPGEEAVGLNPFPAGG